MKKSIVAAGAASLVMAAMPVVGVFAASDPTIVDTLNITVADYCIFKSGSQNDSYSATVAAGALETFSTDSHKMTVTCTGLYKITPTMTSLTATGLAASTAITYSATAATAGSQTWSAAYTLSGDHTGSGAITSGTAINGSATKSTSGDIYALTYKVGLSAAQPAGTYTGTATYVLQTRTS